MFVCISYLSLCLPLPLLSLSSLSLYFHLLCSHCVFFTIFSCYSVLTDALGSIIVRRKMAVAPPRRIFSTLFTDSALTEFVTPRCYISGKIVQESHCSRNFIFVQFYCSKKQGVSVKAVGPKNSMQHCFIFTVCFLFLCNIGAQNTLNENIQCTTTFV